MAVLAAAALPLVIGLLLPEGVIADGETEALLRLALMAVLHGAAGWVSWSCRATGWGDGILWAAALLLHTLTYPLNWDLYKAFTGQGGMLDDVATVLVIFIPSLLMYAGPYRAIIRPPSKEPPAAPDGGPEG